MKTLSKSARSLLAAALVLAAVLGGCGETPSPAAADSSGASPEQSSPSEPASEEAPVFTTKDLLLSTSSSTSSYYTIGAGIADMVNQRNFGFTISATTSGGSVDNVNRIANGEAELGSGMPDVVYEAANGLGGFSSPVPIASLCSMWSNPLNVVVRDDGKINSIADLRGKRVSVGAAGTGSQATPIALLNAYGIAQDEVEWSFAPIGEQCNMLKDGQIDAIMMTMGMGNASFTDLAATTAVKWLDADPEKIQSVTAQTPFYCEVDIPAQAYPGITQTVHCLGFCVNLYASTERVSDDQAYLIVKTIFDNPEEIARYHAVGNDITLETALEGLATEPHPGAARYFREKGLIE